MTANRIPAMDVLRGCAILGILWMNITAFAFPNAVYYNPAAAGPLTTADTGIWALGFVLIDGKMRGLFSLLFGASMLLFIDKEEMAGRNGTRAQLIRAGWLLVIGLAHYLLLWWGDILMIYAVVCPFALLFVQLEPIALVKRAFLMFLLHLLICLAVISSLYAWGEAAHAADASAQLKQGYTDFMGALSDPANPSIREDYGIYRGGYAGIVASTWKSFPSQWLMGLLLSGFDTLGFMLLGMAMAKAGFLTGRWEREQYRRTARHCFLIGLPPMIALAVWVIAGRFEALRTFAGVLLWSFPFRIPLTVGWAALILWLLGRAPGAAVTHRLAAAGRMTLSNYLGTSIVMAALFHGWGFGLFGRISHAGLSLFVLGGWALILLWSKPWLNRFATGPAELLWRSLSLGKMQKIRKSG